MTATAGSAPFPQGDRPSGTASRAPRGFTAPPQRTGEPLLRLDTTGSPVEAHPESHPAGDERGTEAPTLIAEGAASGDRQRPTELAAYREEQRQIMAISNIVCRATLEVLGGARPVLQLQRWMELETWNKVAERAELMAPVRKEHGLAENTATSSVHAVQVRSMRCERVRPGVWEVAVVLGDDLRTRACGLRVEAHRRRWRVVALELG